MLAWAFTFSRCLSLFGGLVSEFPAFKGIHINYTKTGSERGLRNCNRCTRNYSVTAMANRLWGLLLLLMMSPQSVTSLNVNLSGKEKAFRVLVAMSYPSVRIGPHSWRYFRVEVPPAFAELSISLTRKWTGEHIGNNYKGHVPMVCFRFGSPPLPSPVLESPQTAAMAAAKAENPTGTGKCAWFDSNASIALTNMQIVAGVWYVGVFSDPQPSRFQAKMISRGSIFTFGIHFTVLGCKSPNLGGHDCGVAVKPLCYETSEKMGEKLRLEASLTQQGAFRNEILYLNQGTTSVSETTWASWKSQHVGPNEWKHFVLEVAEIALRLQVRAIARVNVRGAKIYLKYGALPDEGDNGTAMSSAPISVSVPRRGPWYIAVHNSNMTKALDFDLYLQVKSCSTGGINSMERVLVEDAQESPFNSFYGPARKEGLLYSPWFFLSEVTHIGNATSGNWTYLFIEVPRGAAGAVLSVQLRHVVQATMIVYARLEGLATPDHWDIKTMNMEDKDRTTRTTTNPSGSFAQEKNNNKKLSLDLVYPAEGIWCIGVHYVKHVASAKGTNIKNITPQQLSIGRLISIRVRNAFKSFMHWYYSFVEWLRMLWRKSFNTHNSIALDEASALSGNKEADIGIFLNTSRPSFGKQPLMELSSKRRDLDTVQMHISVHGCVNKCSGKGRCVTSYESSRLHFISNCHCDAAHGGIDCGVPLLVPTEETLHVLALIGSNAAALLPSFWAIRHQAYSEWVSYVASGVSSCFYHSCDAGGWCALSYDTLQFLDFWLSFMVVIMTCLSVASLKHDTKAVAHVAAAIITAAATKENATSAWNVLLVVLMGLAGMLLGWALECWRLRLIPSWISAIRSIRPVLRMDSIYHRGEQLLGILRARFQWFYLTTGLGILFAAGLTWVLETADTYWIWHSLWHVSIYTSAFVILCSTSKSSWTPSETNTQGYKPTPSDPEAAPILRHTVELDAFVNERDRSLDD